MIAVNAGSNDISIFRVRHHGLDLIDNVDSGGSFPTSVTLDRNLFYVLNAGQDGNEASHTGLELNRYAEATPLPGSTRELGTGGFHQISFTPRGDTLIVTQGGSDGPNAIHVFGINEDGLPDETPTVSPSSGIVPFGLIFDWREHHEENTMEKNQALRMRPAKGPTLDKDKYGAKVRAKLDNEAYVRPHDIVTFSEART